MFVRKKAYSGYLLVENMVAFFIVTLVLLEIVPLFIFMRQQLHQERLSVTAARYGYELVYDRVWQSATRLPTMNNQGSEYQASSLVIENEIVEFKVTQHYKQTEQMKPILIKVVEP